MEHNKLFLFLFYYAPIWINYSTMTYFVQTNHQTYLFTYIKNSLYFVYILVIFVILFTNSVQKASNIPFFLLKSDVTSKTTVFLN